MKYFISLFLLHISLLCFSQNKNIIIQNNENNKIFLVQDKNSILYTKLLDFSEFNIVYDKNDVTNGNNSKWLKVEKYQNKYVLYIPCDSQYERKFIIENFHLKIKMGEIEKYKHIKHGSLGQNGFYGEYEMDPISKQKFSLKANVINQEPLVYQFKFSFNNKTYEENYIKIHNIRDFDIIYNQCRDNKADEFKF